MAELEVDHSSLAPVQEVSQFFSLLEDGALAHNLQEQEIESFYSNNVQRNQLVQKDIRVAKRLQNEEKQRAHTLHRQATRQLEEQDSEYARRIQDDIQQAAEAAWRREEEDEEIAKRIQEEDELRLRQSNSCRRPDHGDNGSVHNLPHTPRPSQVFLTAEEEQTRHNRVRFPSPPTSDCEEDCCEDVRPGFRNSRETVNQRNRSDQRLPWRNHSEQNHRTSTIQNGMTRHVQSGWGTVVQLIKNDLSEQGYLSYDDDDKMFEPVYELERILSRRHPATRQPENRLTRHSSMRLGHKAWQGEFTARRSSGRLLRRSSSFKSRSGGGHRRVHFQDDGQWHNVNSDNRRISEDRHGGIQVARNVRTGRHGSQHVVSRTCNTEEDFQQTSRMRSYPLQEEQGPFLFRERGGWEGRSCRVEGVSQPSSHSSRDDWRQEGMESRSYQGQHGRRHSRHRGSPEERSSTEDEEEERDGERRREERRVSRPSDCHLGVSRRGHSTRAGEVRDRPCLDLGELEQVLRDEELAYRLQQLERLHSENSSLAAPSPTPCPVGDFTVAQVAQDEEIARYMQKEEFQAQMRSQQLENCGPVRGYRAMSHVYDDNRVNDGQMPRERLYSEGLVSPGYESSPERQPSSHTTLAVEQQHLRNVVEDLDPTFPRNDSGQAEQNIAGTLHMQSTPQTGTNLGPAFVTPTKRQKEKSLKIKSKEKKESTKRKGSCKQQ